MWLMLEEVTEEEEDRKKKIDKHIQYGIMPVTRVFVKQP